MTGIDRDALARVIRDCHIAGRPYREPGRTDWRAFADAVIAHLAATEAQHAGPRQDGAA
jgi:hypothetical protein